MKNRQTISMNTPITDTDYYLAHVQQYLARTRTPQYATLETASLLYKLPVWDLPEVVSIIAPAPGSKLTPLKGTSLKIRKICRHYPQNAYQEVNDTPTLTPAYYILEQLHHNNPINAFVGADAMLRKLLNANPRLKNQQQHELEKWRKHLQELASNTDLGFYTDRVHRRLPLIDPYAENPFETALRILLLQAGITEITVQHQVQNPLGAWVFVDLYLPQLQLICVIDWRDYLSPTEYEGTCSDSQVIEALQETGQRILLFHPAEIANPEAYEIVTEKLRSLHRNLDISWGKTGEILLSQGLETEGILLSADRENTNILSEKPSVDRRRTTPWERKKKRI